MSVAATVPGAALGEAPGGGESPAGDGDVLGRAGRAAELLLALLPGALVVYFGFRAGGFFPSAPALAALILAQLLALRTVLAERPFPARDRLLAIQSGALALLAVWSLASALWSDAEARALLEFTRTLLYLLALVLFGTMAQGAGRLDWMIRGLAVGALVVCGAGLISRALPDVLAVAPDIANNRLGYPATYPNAMGLLAALGVLLAFHLSSSREPRSARVLAAAALPAFLVTLYFTFSRGAMLAGAAALLVYMLAARPRAALPAAIAALPPAVVALVAAYGADLLASVEPTTAAATAQGHHVARVTAAAMLAAGLLRLILLGVDRRLDRLHIASARRRRRVVGGAAAGGALLVIVAALALGVPAELGRQYDRFVSNEQSVSATDQRARLTSLDNGYRLEFWRAALRGYRAEPARGAGAGTYELQWSRERPVEFTATDGHSLYLETLAELGVPGLALLLVVIAAMLWAGVAVARGPARHAGGLVLAAVALWAIHAGVDWDWEMPVLTLPIFALAGAAVAARPGERGRLLPGREARMVLAVGWLVVAVAPALVYVSQKRLDGAVGALARGDCPAASDEATASLSWLAARPQPYAVLGYCNLERGLPALAVSAMGKAVERDPHNWEMRFGLALAEGAAGADPRPSAAHALRLNPREPLVRDFARAAAGGDPTRWRTAAAEARAAALESRRLSISPF